MGDVIPISFKRKCSTARDFAQRYRVLAAMSPDGVSFTMQPAELRAMADVFDELAQRPVLVAVVEVDKPLSWFWSIALAFIIAAQAMMIGEIAAAVIWAAFR